MEENEVLVKVEGLSKKFCKDLKTSLKYGVQDLFSNWWGNKDERLLRDKEFWAVRNISFELRRGECLGLIGHNGAGKSTLLKIMNGLIKPDAGKVTIKGKVGALIELGAGFNPILTGRENIYNNGAVLGFSRKEIESKVEEIIDFSEIREFIDMPVQNYSSGMKVRLGFAVAAQMQPDVLIIDEVLAVGDLGFVLKCYKTIDKLLPKTAIVFVSHSMPMVSRICNNILLMHKGETIIQGVDIGKAIDTYYGSFKNNERNIIFSDNSVVLENIEFQNINYFKDNIAQIDWGGEFKLKLGFKFNRSLLTPKFIIVLYDKEKREIAYFNENTSTSKLKIINNRLEFIIHHKSIQLSKGFYSLDVSVHANGTREPLLRVNNAIIFHINHEREIFPSFLLESDFKQI